MNVNQLINRSKNEKPLDNLVLDGGFISIFPTIACIGDSLSSGELEHVDENGNKTNHDKFEFSWGQFIARSAGIKVYDFSRGGMTAKEYIESFAEENDFYNTDKKSTAYIIALGVNDILNQHQEIGSINDIDINNPLNNKDTFAGWYGKIISKYKEISPNAKFFFVTMPKENSLDDKNDVLKKKHSILLNELNKIYSNSYGIDLYKYAPLYDKEFKDKFFLEDHMNPAGYKLTAIMISSYVDYIIRKDFKSFKQVSFICTNFYRKDLEK